MPPKRGAHQPPRVHATGLPWPTSGAVCVRSRLLGSGLSTITCSKHAPARVSRHALEARSGSYTYSKRASARVSRHVLETRFGSCITTRGRRLRRRPSRDTRAPSRARRRRAERKSEPLASDRAFAGGGEDFVFGELAGFHEGGIGFELDGVAGLDFEELAGLVLGELGVDAGAALAEQ